jgi:hypothetical protein
MAVTERTLLDGSKRYDARIKRNYQSIHLGTFTSEEEARQAEQQAMDARPQYVHQNRRRAIELIGEDNVELLYRHGLCLVKSKRRR